MRRNRTLPFTSDRPIHRCGRLATRFLLALSVWAIPTLAGSAQAARSVEIQYHKDVWLGEAKEGIQFISPTEGWVGVSGYTGARGKPRQPYLLTTTSGPDGLHPVPCLQLPVNHRLTSFFFLDRQSGWVVAAEVKLGGGPTRLWRTTDGGRSWQELAHNLPPEGGQLQFVTPTRGWLLGGGHLWRTEDGGSNWRRLPLADIGFSEVLFLASAEGVAVGRGTIYRTEDGGETWTRRYTTASATQTWMRSLQFPTPTEGWVIGDGTLLLREQDGGRTWRPIHPRHVRMGPYDAFTSVHFLTPDVGVVAGQHDERETVPNTTQKRFSPMSFDYYRPYLLVTFNGGQSWSYHDLPIPVSQWSRVGLTLFGINAVQAAEEEAGIVEVRLTPPRAKPPAR